MVVMKYSDNELSTSQHWSPVMFQQNLTDFEGTNYSLHSRTFPLINTNLSSFYNQCEQYSEKYPDFSNHKINVFLFSIFYVVIFVAGIVGNSTMLLVTLSRASLISVQNVYLMNLAVSDIIVCLLSVPITPVVLIKKEWHLGLAMCHLITWIQGSSIFISTLTLTAIACDRYRLVVHPRLPPTSIRCALCVTGSIWIFSGVVALPYAYVMNIERHVWLCGEFCTENWPSKNLQKSFTTVVFVFQFVIPFAIMAYCYAVIFNRLKKHVRDRISQGSSFDREKKLNLARRKKRSTVLLLCMVLIFALTWMPHNVVQMISNYAKDTINSHYVYFVNLSSHSFAMLNILANPILYTWLNNAFREILLQLLLNAWYFVCRKENTQRRIARTELTGRYREVLSQQFSMNECPQDDKGSIESTQNFLNARNGTKKPDNDSNTPLKLPVHLHGLIYKKFSRKTPKNKHFLPKIHINSESIEESADYER